MAAFLAKKKPFGASQLSVSLLCSQKFKFLVGFSFTDENSSIHFFKYQLV